jgi:DNA-binding transcriptional ArsR family regulator
MAHPPNLAAAAFLLADPARAAMLMRLADGSARPAGELAFAAGVTAQTASSHLSKLLAGGALVVEAQGRHRYYRLAGPHVAVALENLAVIVPAQAPRRTPPSREAERLRFARCCYDHLAGRVGVAVTGALAGRGFIVASGDRRYDVTPAGRRWFARIGLDVATLPPARRGHARQCLDWTERQHHLAGPLGVRLLHQLCANGWLRRTPSSRVVQVTPLGRAALRNRLGVDIDTLAGEA